jgi:hypothetical protein
VGPVDDNSQLTQSTQDWHNKLVTDVPYSEDNWKYHWLKHVDLSDDFLESCFQHLEDLGKTSNKRFYIGPGRDGSSDDKVAIDCKFDPNNTTIPFNKRWNTQGYRKSSFSYTEEEGCSRHEILSQDCRG